MRSGQSRASLRDAFVADLSAVWKWFGETNPEHTPYAFALYGMESAQQLIPQVLTEQALTSVAQDYVKRGLYDEVNVARRALRYSVADSPLFNTFLGKLPTVDRLLTAHGKTLESANRSVILVKAGVAALKKMDEMAVFGSGKPRDGILLMIALDSVDDGWIDTRVKQLNPKKVFSRYVEDTKPGGPFVTCDVLAASPDGKTFCAAGSRANLRAKAGSSSEFISQVVGFEIVGETVRRRWTYEFPQLGDSGRAVRHAPNDDTFVVLRARYRKRRRTAILMRFGRNSRRPLARKAINGEPAGLAISHDGACIAITMHDQELVVMDRHFDIVYRSALGFRPGGVLFLPSGDLLVGGDNTILRIAAGTGSIIDTVAQPGRNMSIDSGAKFLAVSRWFDIAGDGRTKPFGLRVLSLPSFNVYHEYHISGQQVVLPSLSSDGTLLALRAHEVDGHRTSVVVFDNHTGREIAERRCDSGAAIEFLPNSRTLAITKSGHLVGEPIELWPIPVFG